MPASNKPNTTAIRALRLPLTPLTPIPIDAARLDSPTATARSSRASTRPRYPPSPQSSRTRAFEPEQQLLAVQAAAVAGEAAVAADHPVARHDDGDRVGALGRTHAAPGGPRLPHGPRPVP